MVGSNGMSDNLYPWNLHWKEQREIARGGQGIATELHSNDGLATRAVLKQIVPRWRDDPQARQRLRQEAEILGKLNDLGAKVPKLFDSFLSHPDSDPFLLMEFISGMRFDEWLKSCAPVAPKKAVCITKAIADTISLCHKHSIGHRDLKPTNIILKDGDINSPYILDFGICFDSRQTMILTREGEMFWNEFIILPECQDLEGGHRDLRSDITALVGVFFSCITGKPPIVLRDAQDRAPHHRYENLVVKSAVSVEQGERLMWFFERGFAFRIADRFQSMSEFTSELACFAVESNEERLDPTEQFIILSRKLASSDRSVQLVALREKYQKITTATIDALDEKFETIKQHNGFLRNQRLNLKLVRTTPEARALPDGELLGGEFALEFAVKREHYSGEAIVLFIGCAIGMDIHLFAASYIGPIKAINSSSSPLEWSKIAVIEDLQHELSDRALAVIVEGISSKLAREIRNLILNRESK